MPVIPDLEVLNSTQMYLEVPCHVASTNLSVWVTSVSKTKIPVLTEVIYICGRQKINYKHSK